MAVVQLGDGEAGAWPEAEQALVDELGVAGFTVEQAGTAGRDGLAAVAEAKQAEAVVRVEVREGEGAIDLYVLDRARDSTAVHHIDGLDPADAGAPTEAALRVVELLNSIRLEVDDGPVPTVRQEASPPPPRWPPVRVAVRGGFSVLGTPGMGAMAGPALGLRFGVHPNVAIDLETAATALHHTVDEATGTARIGVGHARLLLVGRYKPHERVALGLGAGAGVLVAWALASDAPPGYAVGSAASAVADLGGSATAAVALADHVRLFAGFGVHVAVPEITVAFDGEPVARMGRPLLDGTVGLEGTW